jgi:hypothetical protein
MPDIVRRKLRDGIREFEILSKEEASDKGLSVVGWRDAKPGEWALTDDGFVCECLDRKTFVRGRHSQDLVVLSFCRQWVTKTPLNYLAYKGAGAHGTSPTPWVILESRKTRTKNMVKVFVQMMLNHNIDYTRLGIVYRPDQRIPAATARRLLKEEVIKKMVDIELSKVLSSNGITKESVIQMYLDAAKIAKENGKAGELRAVASDLADYLEMKPKATKMLEAGFDGVAGQIEEGMRQFDLTVTKEVPVGQMVDADFEVVP